MSLNVLMPNAMGALVRQSLRVSIWIVCLSTCSWLNIVAADDVVPGALKARQACQTCHGGKGRQTRQAETPNLAGQSAAYLEKQLHAYRAGTRQNALMQAVAEALSDEEIAELAAFYSSQRMAYCW